MEPQEQTDPTPPEPVEAKPSPPRKHARQIDCGRDGERLPRPPGSGRTDASGEGG